MLTLTLQGKTYKFEHSLKAISKWESFYNEPFLVDGSKTQEESLYYIKCMCLTDGFTTDLIDDAAMIAINLYLTKSHTATTISNTERPINPPIVTSEILYSYLSICDIPFTSDEWNIDRLLITIQAISALKSPPKKMSQEEILEQNKKINEQRLAAEGL